MLKSDNGWFVDESGRRLLLRGCNLGGDCKVPYRPRNELPSRDEFLDYRKASFVGRPLPEAEADEHLDRLHRWGFNVVRLLVTWEGLEPSGPGEYDEAYYDYIERIAAKCADRGLRIFVDPHQDVWSRWTGGDGAPAWTLEYAGFDIGNLHRSGAAFVHEEAGDPYPRMLWPANYNRLACATMFTLFFAGGDFAPSLEMDGMDSRNFLQGRYIAAISRLAARLSRLDAVIGFDTLNEPGDGYIGWTDASSLTRAMSRTGPMPTPFQAMQAASGFPVEVDVYGIRRGAQRVIGRTVLGEHGLRAWKPGVECLWRREGVWDESRGKPVLRTPGHFAAVRGRTPDFERDYLRPFARRVGEALTKSSEAGRYFLFIESVPNVGHPRWRAEDSEESRIAGAVNASHWYDGLTLTLKRWTGFLGYDTEEGRIVFGPRRLRSYFAEHLGRLRRRGLEDMGGAPTLVGEFGLPFDLNGASAYGTGDYSLHERALSSYYDALDRNLLSATIWNYTASNTHARGDGWNGEDLSIWCRDDWEARRTETAEELDAGGRALRGFVRPYARAIAGLPVSMRFDMRSGRFRLEYLPGLPGAKASAIRGTRGPAVTEIFLPEAQYPRGYSIRVEGGQHRLEDHPGGALLMVEADPGAERVKVLVDRA